MKNKLKYAAILIAVLSLAVFFLPGCGDDSSVTFNTPTGPTGPTGPEGSYNTASLTVTVNPAEANATVSLNRILEDSQTENINPSDSVGNGQYVFTGLFPGTYVVLCEAPGFSPFSKSIYIAQEASETMTVNLTETQIGVTEVTPKVVVNSGDLSAIVFTVIGTDYTGTCTASLTPVSGGDIRTGDCEVLDSQTLRCTFDLTGLTSGEYTFTITQDPLSSSETFSSDTIWLTDTIQLGISKASELYVEQEFTVQILDELSDQVMVFVPPGTYRLNDPALPSEVGNSRPPIRMSNGVYLKGAGNGGADTVPTGTYTMIDLQDNQFGNGGIVYCSGNVNFTIDGFRFTGGSSGGGGAILAQEVGKNITIMNNTFINNHCGYVDTGGAMFFPSPGENHEWCNLSIKDNIVRENYCGSAGGGIAISSPKNNTTVEISGNKIINNYCYSSVGGGIAFSYPQPGSSTLISDNIITGNGASSNGGGIYIYKDQDANPVNISDNTISGNSANRGAGIYVQSGLSYSDFLNINNNLISGNGGEIQDVNLGGTDYNFGPTALGGGIFAQGEVTIEGNTFSENLALQDNMSYAGGLYLDNYEGSLSNNIITGNESSNAGAMAINYVAGPITGNTITGNNGEILTGGIYVTSWDPDTIFTGNTISGNTNNDSGGTPVGGNGVQLRNASGAIIQAQNNDWGVAPGSLTNSEVYRVINDSSAPNVIVQ